MNYQVMHETTYSYESPVVLSQQLLHLTPRVLDFQSLSSHRIEVEPAPAESSPRDDYFGNPVTQILLAAPHASLVVRAESTVSVSARSYESTGERWEALRQRLRAPTGDSQLEPAQFLYESPHVECFRDLAAYAAPSFAAGQDMLQAARDLARRIHIDFTFDPKATSVATPLREVLAKRRGVCQDYAHFMIGCLRTLGLPARYVSGYILTTPPPGKPRLVGADASHAWVSVWCGGDEENAGWVDIDPTNDMLAGADHISIGHGRDYSDISPIVGVFRTNGSHEATQSVDVIRVE